MSDGTKIGKNGKNKNTHYTEHYEIQANNLME